MKDAPCVPYDPPAPLNPGEFPETHPSTGWGWILPRHDAFDLDQLFHLGSLPNSESSAPGRRLQALLRQAEAPGRHMNSRKAFLVGWNVRTRMFFLFGVGGLCVGVIHLSVCFWFGWDKMKVQQVKIKQYIYKIYRLQMLDECFWWVLFIRIAEALKNMKVNEALQFWRSNLAQEEVHTGALEALQLKKGLKKTSWTNWRFHTYFHNILTSLLQWCWVALRLSKHLKNRQNSMPFYV